MAAPLRRVWLALAVVYLVWGSTYFAIKIAVRTLPPLLSAGLRFAVAGTLLACVLALRGTSLRVSRRELLAVAAVGLMLLTFGVGVVHLAETRIDSSVAAMIAGTVPLQVIVLRTLTGEHVARRTRASAIVGLVGLALDRRPGSRIRVDGGRTGTDGRRDGPRGRLGSFVSPRLPLPADPFVATMYEMLAGGLLLVCSPWLAAKEATCPATPSPPALSPPGSTSSSSARSSVSPRTHGYSQHARSRSSSRTSS